MKLTEYKSYLEEFLKEYATNASASGYVLGVSGGVDSAVCLGLLSEVFDKSKYTALVLPIYSNPKEVKDAIDCCKHFNCNYKVIQLDEQFDQLVAEYSKYMEVTVSVKSNLKARLRMLTLYAYAQANNYLVLGTDNLDETYTGYFTKFGDGAADVFILRRLLKKEVYELGKLLKVPEIILKKAPTADLFPNQTDEKEMGITYKVLDDYLEGKEVSEKERLIIERLHKVSEHKRQLGATPKEFIK